MRNLGRRFPCRTTVAVMSVGVGMAAGVPPVSAEGLDVVAEGLVNPRGMSFGPGGALYVAEAGRGGSGPCIAAEAPDRLSCYGATGAIARIHVKSGRTRRIVRGLPSLAPQNGGPGATIGPHDISFGGRTAYFTVGLGADPAARAELGPAGPNFASLHSITPRGEVRRLADLGAHEAQHDPDTGRPGAVVSTNPYSVDATLPQKILVTDAAANDLLTVAPTGSVATLTVFAFGETPAPAVLGLAPGALIAYQPAPTGVIRGRRGIAYVGTRTGFPFPAGAATLYRTHGALAPRVAATGFTAIVDVALGDDSIYVLQMSRDGLAGPRSRGKLIRVARSGRQTELLRGLLKQPTGLAVSPRGDVYVANEGMSPGDAQIVRIRQRATPPSRAQRLLSPSLRRRMGMGNRRQFRVSPTRNPRPRPRPPRPRAARADSSG